MRHRTQPDSISAAERSAMLILASIALGFGALFVVTTVLYGDVRLALFTVTVMGTGGAVLWARGQLDGERRQSSLLVVAWLLLADAVVGALLLPGWQPTFATVPIAALLVAGRVLGLDLNGRLLVPVLATELVVFGAPLLLPPPTYAVPAAAVAGFGHLTFVAIIGFALLMVAYERRRLVETWASAQLLSATLDETLTHLEEAVVAEDSAGHLVVCNPTARRFLGQPDGIPSSLAALEGGPLDASTSWERPEGLWVIEGGRRVPVAASLRVFEDGPLRSVLVVRSAEAERAARRLEVEHAAAEAKLSGAELIDQLTEALAEPLAALADREPEAVDALREILGHHQVLGRSRAGDLLGHTRDVDLPALVAAHAPPELELRCPAPVTVGTDPAVLGALLGGLLRGSRWAEIGPGPRGVRVRSVGALPRSDVLDRAAGQLLALGGALGHEGEVLWLDLPESAPGDYAGHRPVEQDTLTILRRGLDQLQQCVVVLDAEGSVVYANPWWLKRSDAGVGAPVQTLSADPGLMVGWRQAQAGTVWRGQLSGWGPKEEALSTVLAPVRSGGGDVTHVLLLQHDPATQTALEERLEEVDRLASDIAHELSSPLAALSAFLELEPDREVVNDARAAFAQVATVVGRLRQLGGRDVELPPAAVASAPAGPARIFAVDDEAVILGLVRRALRSHQVETSDSGAEALPRLLAEPWDLVLCDLMLPGMSGMELHRRVAAERPELASRFVFVSGGVTIPAVADWLAGTDARVLAKPFLLADLNAVVAEVIGRGAPCVSTAS